MRLQPFLARATVHSVSHSVVSAGVMAVSLLYILVPFTVLDYHSPTAQVLSEPLEATLSPSLAASTSWARPGNPHPEPKRASFPQEAPSLENPLMPNAWT